MCLSTEAQQLLIEGSSEILGRALSAGELEALSKYLALLTKWQRTQRLVGSVEPGWLIDNAVLDSLLFSRLLPPDTESVADVGSGAGVPGIPLKVVRPAIRFTLIESRERRASFLAAVVRELELRDCRVARGRAESVGIEDRNQDVVVVRCAGRLDDLIPLVLPLLRPYGMVIASGPPRPRPGMRLRSGSHLDIDWVEIRWTRGVRAFAVYRKAD